MLIYSIHNICVKYEKHFSKIYRIVGMTVPNPYTENIGVGMALRRQDPSNEDYAMRLLEK